MADNIIQFRQNNEEAQNPSDAGSEELNDMEECPRYARMMLDEMAKEVRFKDLVLNCIDQAIAAVSELHGLDPDLFEEDEDSAIRFLEAFSEETGQRNGLRALIKYHYRDGETLYRFETFLLPDQDDDHVMVGVNIFKIEDGKYFHYDFAEDAWMPSDCFECSGMTEKQCGYMNEGNGSVEGDLLHILQVLGVPPVDDRCFDALCKRNGKILDLYKEVYPYVTLALIPRVISHSKTVKKEYRGPRGNALREQIEDVNAFVDRLEVILVPDDPFKIGIAVRWDGESYVLCQYAANKNDIPDLSNEYLPFYYIYSSNRNGRSFSSKGFDTPLIKVAETKDVEQIASYVTAALNRYSYEPMDYIAPVSLNKFVVVDQRNITSYSIVGDSELNDSEMQAFKKFESIVTASGSV